MNVISITLKPGVNNYPVAKGNPVRIVEAYPGIGGTVTALFEVDETYPSEPCVNVLLPLGKPCTVPNVGLVKVFGAPGTANRPCLWSNCSGRLTQ